LIILVIHLLNLLLQQRLPAGAQPQPEFKYPVTPDPATAGIEFSTVKPVSEGFDISELNLTISEDNIYQGRAACSKHKH
jgi:hypothetical protein